MVDRFFSIAGSPDSAGGTGTPRRARRRARGRARRGVAALTAAVLTSALGVALTAPPASASGVPLRRLAEARGRYFGTALVQDNLSDAKLIRVAGTQFDMVTPGNEMKWETTEPSRGTFDFGPGDRIVAWAKAHGDRVRGHNLVWHSQLAPWVSDVPSSELKSVMENHITQEVRHYRGQLYAWDVVNEPFNEDGTLRDTIFAKAFGGASYIADALRTAHAADPKAELYLNDYNIDGINPKSDAMYALVKSLKQQGVPIGGVGLEAHFVLGQVPSSMRANIQRFADLGVHVAVTELDDRIELPADTAELRLQAREYAQVVRSCLAVRRCVGVTQWGVGDADSWIPGFFDGYGSATMYDEEYRPKPAYYAAWLALLHPARHGRA